jgi:hypothetical protein
MPISAIQENIQALLQKAQKAELDKPQLCEQYAREALALAQERELPFEQCKALLQVAAAKESAADNSEETETIFKQTIELATAFGFTEQLIVSLSKMSSLHGSTNRLQSASEFIQKAKQHLSSFSGADETLQLSVLYDDISIRYRKGEAGASFIADCLYGVEKSKAINDEGLQTSFLQMLIMGTTKMGDIEASIHYSEQFIAIEEKRNYHMSIVGASIYLTGLYEKLGRIKEAEATFLKAIEASKKLGDKQSYMAVETRRLYFLLNNERFDDAEKICHELFALPELNSMPKGRFEITSAWATILLRKKQIKQAIEIYEKERLTFIEDKVILLKITGKLHELYAAEGLYTAAYNSLLEHQAITKDIYDTEKTKEYTELHARFETKQKEAQLQEAKLQQLNAELKAIKSQMNPHFVFNVMATVSNLIGAQQYTEAQTSLQQFSTLMRATLQQSLGDKITVEEEVLFLENYLKLEKLSLGESFSFEIKVAESIDSGYVRIPSMFLQPLVENSVKHGLRHVNGAKKLEIHFGGTEANLTITIDDNGIGRKASEAINKNRKGHVSFASKALEDRVQLINNQNELKIKLEIVDKESDSGTLAKINIAYLN